MTVGNLWSQRFESILDKHGVIPVVADKVRANNWKDGIPAIPHVCKQEKHKLHKWVVHHVNLSGILLVHGTSQSQPLAAQKTVTFVNI